MKISSQDVYSRQNVYQFVVNHLQGCFFKTLRVLDTLEYAILSPGSIGSMKLQISLYKRVNRMHIKIDFEFDMIWK